jgi:hypothetical protein
MRRYFAPKNPTNNKTPAIKKKIFGPFRFVKPRFPCTMKSSKDMIYMSNKNVIVRQEKKSLTQM